MTGAAQAGCATFDCTVAGNRAAVIRARRKQIEILERNIREPTAHQRDEARVIDRRVAYTDSA